MLLSLEYVLARLHCQLPSELTSIVADLYSDSSTTTSVAEGFVIVMIVVIIAEITPWVIPITQQNVQNE